jgi:hypothetical protein
VRKKHRQERFHPKAGFGRIIYCEAAWLDYLANMDWQQAVSLLIVAATAGLFLRARFRRRKFSVERDTHCGCASAGGRASKSSIVFRARKGARPQIIVKSR